MAGSVIDKREVSPNTEGGTENRADVGLPRVTAARDPRFPRQDASVVPQMIRRRAAEHPNRTFAVFSDESTWTYGEVAERAWRRANGFIGLGVSHGDFVCSWLPVGPAVIETWFGANAAGATFAPINVSYRGMLLQNALNIAGAKVLVAHVDLVPRLIGLELEHLETVVVVGDGDADLPGLRVVRWDALYSDDATCPAVVDELDVWDEMALIFTSGTTGASKGVRITYLHHYNAALSFVPPESEVGADDRFFVCLPMFHGSGTWPTYMMLQRGGSVAVVPGFSTSTFWQDTRRLGATVVTIMGAMIEFLAKQPERPDDADNPIRLALLGPLPDYIEEWCRRFDMDVYSLYGTTELPSPLLTGLNPADTKSCGRMFDPENYELRVVDEHDQEVPHGVVGELIARHSVPWSLNLGYKGMPESTAKAWRNGWFHTGDAFMRDAEGNFYFVDRFRDAIRRRGENVSSLEVEQIILTHPSVALAACVAVDNVNGEYLEQEIKACVVLKPGHDLKPRELLDYLVPITPHFMVPRFIEFFDSLPMTPSQKIQKYLLRKDGVTPTTWDRETDGIRIRRERFSQDV